MALIKARRQEEYRRTPLVEPQLRPLQPGNLLRTARPRYAQG